MDKLQINLTLELYPSTRGSFPWRQDVWANDTPKLRLTSWSTTAKSPSSRTGIRSTSFGQEQGDQKAGG